MSEQFLFAVELYPFFQMNNCFKFRIFQFAFAYFFRYFLMN